MSEEKNGFTFFRSYWDGMKCLKQTEKIRLLDAVCEYRFEGIEPDLSGVLMALFIQIRANIDSADKKAAAGKKGGRGNKGGRKEDENGQEKTYGFQEKTYGFENESHTSRMERNGMEWNGKERNILSGKPDDEYGPADQIIMYLNRSAGRAFQLTEKNRERVRTLLELYPEELICMTIDNMVAKWGPDPEMQWYLRPQTLFDPDKFESYMHVVPEGGAV